MRTTLHKVLSHHLMSQHLMSHHIMAHQLMAHQLMAPPQCGNNRPEEAPLRQPHPTILTVMKPLKETNLTEAIRVMYHSSMETMTSQEVMRKITNLLSGQWRSMNSLTQVEISHFQYYACH